MNPATYEIHKKGTPIIAIALHDGHHINANVLQHIKLEEHERFREEDPYTGFMASLPVTHVIVHTSRFYVDLNRAREKAIYRSPEDAWGLQVWKDGFPPALETDALGYYDGFYAEMRNLIEDTIRQHGYFLILDIHSYNHRRESPNIYASEVDNPEINLGTFYIESKWKPVIQELTDYLSLATIQGRHLDVGENIVFKGGGFSQWANREFGNYGSVISIEFKKTFMDEWTGRAYINHLLEIKNILNASIPLLDKKLKTLNNNLP